VFGEQNVLCDLPVIDIDEDEGDAVTRGRKYLESLLRDVRGRETGVSVTWQFMFDLTRSQHHHGLTYVAECGPSSTRVWLLGGAETGGAGKRQVPAPRPGQFVSVLDVCYTALTADDLLRAIAEIMVNGTMSA